MINCPFCHKEIRESSLKCEHCGEYLKDDLRRAAGQKPKWYFKTSTLIVGFLMIGPFILPVIWFNPTYSKTRKAVLTVIILIISSVLFVTVKDAFVSINDYYNKLQENINY